MNKVVDFIESDPADTNDPLVVRLLIMNAEDPDVGELVRSAHQEKLQASLTHILGSDTKAAYFIAVLLGIPDAETSLRIGGLPKRGADAYRDHLIRVMSAALECCDQSISLTALVTCLGQSIEVDHCASARRPRTPFRFHEV